MVTIETEHETCELYLMKEVVLMEFIIRDEKGRLEKVQRELVRQLVAEALEQVRTDKTEDFNLVCARMERRCCDAEV